MSVPSNYLNFIGNLAGYGSTVLGGQSIANANNSITNFANSTPLQPWQINNNGVTAGYAGNNIVTNLGPDLSNAGAGLRGLAASGAGAAGGFMNGPLPANIAAALGTYNNNFGGISPGLASLFANNVTGNGAATGLIGAGFGQLNNPLIGAAGGAALNQIGTAGADFNSVYQTQLANLQKQLQLPQQLQINANQSGQFARGQLGTTGGALQTQAMAAGFGQADLAAASQAYQQALAAQNSATQNAGILGTLASNQQLTGTSLLNSGFNGLTGTGYAGNYLGNSLNQLGINNLNTQSQIATLPSSLAGSTLSNVVGPSLSYDALLNNLGLSNFDAALHGGEALSGSNALAARTLQTNPYTGQTGASSALGAAGSLFGGSNSSTSGLISDISKLYGGGSGGSGGWFSSLFGGAGSGVATDANFVNDLSDTGSLVSGGGGFSAAGGGAAGTTGAATDAASAGAASGATGAGTTAAADSGAGLFGTTGAGAAVAGLGVGLGAIGAAYMLGNYLTAQDAPTPNSYAQELSPEIAAEQAAMSGNSAYQQDMANEAAAGVAPVTPYTGNSNAAGSAWLASMLGASGGGGLARPNQVAY